MDTKIILHWITLNIPYGYHRLENPDNLQVFFSQKHKTFVLDCIFLNKIVSNYMYLTQLNLNVYQSSVLSMGVVHNSSLFKL